MSGPILKSKAEELARKLGKPEFVATDGWLTRWKVRNQMNFKRTHGEKASVDSEGAEEWISTVLPRLLHQYEPEDIYNMDETGVYYRATQMVRYAILTRTLAALRKLWTGYVQTWQGPAS